MKNKFTHKLLVALCLVAMLASMSGTAHALSSYLTSFNTRYGTTATKLNSCLVCHDTSPAGMSWNAYGNAVENQIANLGLGIAASLAAIESLDSDGDGYSNLAEIQARTFPGISTDFPVASAPAIAVTPSALAFGSITTGTAAALTVTITNTGNAALSITALTISGATTFTLTSPPALPLGIAAGGSTVLTVRYAPIAAGAGSGTLAITSNDSAKPTVNVTLSGTGVVPLAPVIGVTPATLAFGNVLRGTNATLSVTVTNTGNAALSVTNLTVTGTAELNLVTPPSLPLNINAGGSTKLNVRYTPSNTGPDNGILAIASNDSAHPTVNVSLTGTGIAPALTVTPASLNFGSLRQGLTTNLAVTLGNSGSADCYVNPLAKTGSADFAWAAGAPVLAFVITPGSSVVVPIAYTPSDVGPDSGSVQITSNDPNNPSVAVPLNGNGDPIPPTSVITLTPASLAYGPVRVGQPKTLNAIIGNTGGTNCVVTDVTVTGTNFVLGTTPITPFNVAAGANITVPIIYTPGALGNGIGTLTVTSTDPNNPILHVSLAGSGVLPHIGVTPLATDFGTITTGGNATRSITIANSGDYTLTVTSILMTASAEFTYAAGTPAPPFTIASGQSTNIVLKYAPVDVGVDTGTLGIGSDDPNAPLVTVALTAAGQEPVPVPQVTVTPLARNFGDVRVGTNNSLTVTVNNNGGAVAHISAPGLAGSTEFSTSTSAFDVAAGTSQNVILIYTPTGVGSDAGTLTITSNDPINPTATVTLAGRGVQPSLAVSSTTVAFGSVVTNGSLARVVSIVNNGSVSAQVSALTITGSSEFSLGATTPSLPFTVAPNASVDVPLNYKPTNVGADTGSLDIASDDPAHPHLAVGLSGSGISITGAVDLDIVQFQATSTYEIGTSKPIQITLRVMNRSKINGARPATVVGVQNDAEVYRTTLPVSSRPGRGNALFTFPTYTPTATGSIQWVATIDDDDPDADVATATTRVTRKEIKPVIEDENENETAGGSTGSSNNNGNENERENSSRGWGRNSRGR